MVFKAESGACCLIKQTFRINLFSVLFDCQSWNLSMEYGLFVNSSKKRFCWQTVFLGMDWLFSAMISRGSLLQLHIWGRRPTHQLLPLVVDNSLVCQEEWKRTCLLSRPGQASGGTNYMYKYSSCRAVTWSVVPLGQLHSACLLTDTPAAGGRVSSALLWSIC